MFGIFFVSGYQWIEMFFYGEIWKTQNKIRTFEKANNSYGKR